ncbi:MAG: pantetheine-phosphate adenylyltransferase [Planctomycetes bacterium]|nr:pantetheine-phosphate adenylyltransferase [Planctomycetota bacterium]
MKRRGVYAGSFDPVTYGHLDVIKRGAQLFDELIVAIATNISKSPLFTLDERKEMLIESTAEFDNVRVDTFDGMAVDFVRKVKANALLRGIRTISDFESEFQMALTNRTFAPDIETVFVMASLEYSFISSRLIREAGSLGGDISNFVPPTVAKKLEKALAKK